ncbi:MAG: penicillin-insensitive murein endopeptidase [Gammaproteobacteria bacterium]|nr:penicillin-insensitive murein endopeptidase [Gammaproteobacteria bacterium]
MLAKKRVLLALSLTAFIGWAPLAAANTLTAESATSQCYGSTSKGRVEDAVQLPARGENFIQYSRIARVAGRTYVHSVVRDIVVASYADLARSHPDKVFKYAETGFANGGQFKPHKTHQNGLSIDFMTPMIDQAKQSVHLPTHFANRFGYDIELSANGEYQGLTIDYEALAAHIVALHRQARAKGYDLWRVIFAPKLQPPLFKTQYGDYLKQHIQFSQKPSWVRHDEHYHVDFKIPCKPL